jgi:glycosyltransferase involved in cell wall biosynthesis
VSPRVLAIADRPGWAIDRKTQNLRRALAGSYEIVPRFQHEVTVDDLDSCDLVLLYYWLQLTKLSVPESELAARSDRLLLGICSQFELEGERREPGLAVLRRLPRAVFANNRGLVRAHRDAIGRPIHYTPNGVDTTFFSPAPVRRARRPGELRVGWAGSLTNQGPEHRGLDAVIRPAVDALPGATLHAAIREERWRTAAEMRDFYRDLDVYVCASASEGAPNPCLEAAACGVTLVTTRVGCMPELVRDGENGLFFERGVGPLVEQLGRLRDDPPHAARLAHRMLDDIRAWDWSVQAQRYARMFDAVLGESAARRPGTTAV